jgi:excisionase family DNA binding protein
MMNTMHTQSIRIINPTTTLPRFLRVGEVAELLRFKRRTIYDMVEQRRIPYRRVGGRLLFDLDEIVEWTKGGN